MTMLEKIAGAIGEAEGFVCDAEEFKKWAATNPVARQNWDRLLGKARAALEALREPTDGMVKVGQSKILAYDFHSSVMDAFLKTPELCWQAMVDAAIEEGKDK